MFQRESEADLDLIRAYNSRSLANVAKMQREVDDFGVRTIALPFLAALAVIGVTAAIVKLIS